MGGKVERNDHHSRGLKSGAFAETEASLARINESVIEEADESVKDAGLTTTRRSSAI